MKYGFCYYWHSPIFHAMYLTVVVAYYMYPEVVEEELYQVWKDENIVDF